MVNLIDPRQEGDVMLRLRSCCAMLKQFTDGRTCPYIQPGPMLSDKSRVVWCACQAQAVADAAAKAKGVDHDRPTVTDLARS